MQLEQIIWMSKSTELSTKSIYSVFFILGAKTTAKKRGKFANSSGLFQHGIHTHQTCSKNSQISSHFE